MPNIFFSFAIFTGELNPVHGQKLQSWDLVISVTYFILSQEIVFLLWLLPSEELWISRGYEVCAAATMEPDGPQAGIFHLGFSLQGMIFPGMRHNPWAKVCDSNCIYVSALSRVSEMGAEVLPKQENLSVLYTVGSKALQYQANIKMVLNKKNQITLFATSVSNLQFRQWSHICQSNLLLLKQHSLTYTHDMFGLFSSIFLYLIFFLLFFFFPLQLSVSISMQVASLELVLLLLSCVLSAKDKNHMSETRTTSVRPAATNPSMILMGPSGKLSVLNLHWVHLWGKRTSEERKGRWHVNGMSFVFLQVLEGWSSRRCIFRSSGNYGSHRYS